MNKKIRLIKFAFSCAFLTLFAGSAYPMCGTGVGETSEFSKLLPKLNPANIYDAVKSNDIALATSLLKKTLVSILGSDFPLPKPVPMPGIGGNPALFKPGKKGQPGIIEYYPESFKAASLSGLIKAGDELASVLIILAHELVHAWQYHNTDLLKLSKKEEKPDKNTKEAIVEGHAVFVQSILAKMYGISRQNDEGIQAIASIAYGLRSGSKEKAQKIAEGNELTRMAGCMLFLYPILNPKSSFSVNDLIYRTPTEGLPEEFVKDPAKYEQEITRKLS